MSVRIVLIFLSVLSVCTSIDHNCINGCTCTKEAITCDCASAGISEIYLLFFNLPTRSDTVNINNCDTVHLYPWNSLFSTPLRAMKIDNIKHLNIQKNAFNQVTSMDKLLITNTHIENWTDDSLGDIQTIHRLHLINVTSDSIPPNLFRNLNQVGDFLISNSKFEKVDTNAFVGCNNISRFEFVNSSVNYFKPNSLTLNHVHLLVIANLSVTRFESGALVARNVQNLVIRHSRIRELYPEALTATNVMSISIRHNIVGTLHPGAFLGLGNVTEFDLSGNLFGTVKNSSILLDPRQVKKRIANSNRFMCRSSVCWFFDVAQTDDFLNQIVKTSTCVSPEPLKGKPLTTLQLLTDDADFCDEDQSSGDFGQHFQNTDQSITDSSSGSLLKDGNFGLFFAVFMCAVWNFELTKLY